MRQRHFPAIRLAFHVAMLAVGFLLAVAIVAIYLSFGRFLIGDITLDDSAQLLTRLDAAAFTQAKAEWQARQQQPYFPGTGRNPFAASSSSAGSAPATPAVPSPATVPQMQ